MNERQEWLTVKEAMNMLRCSKPTLYRYIRAGKIKATKIIGKTLVNMQSVNEALQPQ